MGVANRRWDIVKRPTAPGVMMLGAIPWLIFLLAPTLIVIPMALTKSDLIQFPPVWISLHSFIDYFGDDAWMDSTLVSIKVAAVATAVATVAGTCAAFALHSMRGGIRMAISSIIMLPIIAPVIVLALGDYLVLGRVGLLGDWRLIALGHSLLGVPYVFLSVQTSLSGLDIALVRSARSLGARAIAVTWLVYWPALRPGILAGAVFAFYVSFDEVILALFLQGPGGTTLPVQMFASIQYELSPKVAAVSSLLVTLAALALLTQSAFGKRGARQPNSKA